MFRVLLRSVVAIGTLACGISFAHAASYYWDVDGTGSPGAGGGTTPNGTWDGANAFWNPDSTGSNGAGVAIAAPTTADDLFFSAGVSASGSYAVTVNGIQSAKSLAFDDGMAALDTNTVNLGATAGITVNAASASISSALSGAGTSLTKLGTGTVTLTGTNTFTGPLTVSEGTLAVSIWNNYSTNGPLGNSAGNVTLGGATTQGTLQYTGAASNVPATIKGLTIAAGGGKVQLSFVGGGPAGQYVHMNGSSLSGSGPLTVDTSNAGALTSRFILVGPSAYSGSITVNANTQLQNNATANGDFAAFGVGSSGNGPAITMGAGSILDVFSPGNTPNILIGSLAGTGSVVTELGTVNYKVGGDNSSTSFSGTFGGGTTSLTKVGTGKFTLSGSNTYTGPLTVADGTLSIATWNNYSTNGPLGNSAGKVTLGGGATQGTLEYTGAASNVPATIKGLDIAAGGGKIQLSFVGGGPAGQYVHMNGSSLTGSGPLTVDTSNAGALTSRFILVGSSAFSGSINVNANSQLQNSANANGDFAAFGVGSSGTGPAITMGSGSVLQVFSPANTPNILIGSLSGGGSVFTELGTVNYKVGGDNSNTAFSGTFGGAGGTSTSFTKAGTGKLTLSGASTYTGTTTISAGTISVNTWNGNSSNGVWGNATSFIQMTGGAIEYTGASASGAIRGVNLVSGNNTIDITTAGTVLNFNSASNRFTSSGGNLIKAGAGTLQLGDAGIANNSFTGKVTINAGTLDWFGAGSMPAPGALVTDFITINNGGTFQLSYNGAPTTVPANIGFNISGNATFSMPTTVNHTIAGVIADGGGAGNLIKTGTGTLGLTGVNTYTGTTTINAGTISVASWNQASTNGVWGNSASLIQMNGGTISYTGPSAAGNIRGVNLASGNNTINISNAATILDFQGGGWNTFQSNGGNLIKTGAGTLQLGDFGIANNVFTGKVTINAGTLDWFGAGSMPAPGALVPDFITINNGGTFQLSYNGAPTTVPANIGFNISGNATFSMPTTVNHTLAGVIANGGGAGNFIKTGTGTLGLTGANTYTGTTNINAGTVAVASWNQASTSGVWGNSASLIQMNGGTISYSGPSAAGNIRGVNLASGNNTIDITNAATTLNFQGGGWNTFQSNGGNLIKAGAGTLQLGDFGIANNIFTGKVTINAGTLDWFGAGSMPSPGAPVADFITINNSGTFQLSYPGAPTTVPANIGFNISGNATFNMPTTVNHTLAGVIANGGGAGNLVKTGTGTLGLGGVNTYTGTTTINAGTVAVSLWNTNSTNGVWGNSTSLIQMNGGQIDYAGPSASGLIRGVNLASGNNTINITSAATVLNFSGASNRFQSNGGNLIKTGAGTLQIGDAFIANNIFSGKVTINAGTLDWFGAGSMPSPGALVADFITINNTGTFQLSYNGAPTTVPANIGFKISDNATFSMPTGVNHTVAGVVGDGANPGHLIKAGAGILALSDTNTYSGATSINGGTLRVVNGANIPDGSAVSLANVAGAALDVNSQTETIGSLSGGGTTGGNVTLSSGTLITGGNGNTTTYAGVISGAGGSLTKSGAGAMTLTNASTYSGDTTVQGGTLNLTTDGSLANTSGVTVGAAGSTAVDTLALNNAAAHRLGTGDLVVGDSGVGSVLHNAGNVTVGDGDGTLENVRIGVGANGSYTIGGAGSTLNVGDNGSGNVAGGRGVLTVGDAGGFSGSLTLNTGATINTGDLNVGNGAAGGTVTQNSGSTINVLNASTYTLDASDLPSLTAVTNQLGGATNVTGGMVLGNGVGAATQNVYNLSGGVLDFGDTSGVTSGNHHGSGTTPSSLTINSDATFNLTGNGTLRDVTTINTDNGGGPGSGAFVQNGGSFYVGQDEPDGLSPDETARKTTIDGGYSLLSGTLFLDIFGPEATPENVLDPEPLDNLFVTGDVILDSTIDLDYVGAYEPGFGDIHTLILASSFTLEDGFHISGGFYRIVDTGNDDFPLALQAIVPEPASLAVWMIIGMAGAAGAIRIKRRRGQRSQAN